MQHSVWLHLQGKWNDDTDEEADSEEFTSSDCSSEVCRAVHTVTCVRQHLACICMHAVLIPAYASASTEVGVDMSTCVSCPG
jgi:hypothetical protein